MLDNQWFAVLLRNSPLFVELDSLPADRSQIVLERPDGGVTILHGSSVVVEETDEYYALAVGDVRDLKSFSKFQQSSPSRHVALCFVYKQTSEIRVITDRINFSKMFCYKNESQVLGLSTHLTLFNTRKMTLSTPGLACFIANGTQFNNLTVFREISVLERASIHVYKGKERTITPHWNFAFDTTSPKGASRQKLKDSLISAVCDQVCGRPILLSLSGGFDSSGILGILARFSKPKSLRTFSYVFGEPRPGSDAFVAREMAAATGYPHTIIQAYDGDILATLHRNAWLGQGVANFCDESDAWHRQGKLEPGAVVLAGDECFGWMDRRLVSTSDVLSTISIRNFQAVSALFPFISQPVREAMTDGLAEEIEKILTRNFQKNLHDLKDTLYLDQRIQWALLPWRRFVVGNYFEVREPLLQTDVLEVVRSMPIRDRLGKALYRKVIQELVPEVFAIPRARNGQAGPLWKTELMRNRNAIEQYLQVPSRLDNVIDPSAISALINKLQTQEGPRQNWKSALRNKVGPATARVLRTFVRPEFSTLVPTEAIVLRLLTLRMFLDGGQSASAPANT